MISGNINTSGSGYLPKAIVKSLEYLKMTDFSTLGNKKYLLDGENRFVVIHEYSTLPASERNAEVHKKYIDIQFMISGQEKIYFGFEHLGGSLVEDKLMSDDYALYRGISNEREISLFPGDYAIFFPGEFHRPGCALEKKYSVRKVVVKIALSELKV